jgi:parvulin-like peptidyl-prolyl isomerase
MVRRSKMQKVHLGIAVIACLLGCITSCASIGEKGSKKGESVTQELPKTEGQQASKKIVAAKVNGAEISMSALVKVMNRIGAKNAAAPTPEDIEAVKKEALDRLILQELAYQKALSQGLRAPREAIDASLVNLKENVGGEEGYKQLLEKEQVTEQELRTQVERSLTLERIFEQEVYQKAAVPEDELKKVYEKEKGNYIKPEKVSVVDVFFAGKDRDDSLAKRADTVRAKILRDKNRDPWKLVLDGTFIVRNYDLRKEKDRDLIEEAKKLKKDEISRVIKTPDGAHIVKLREYSPERQLTLEEIRPNLEKQLRAPAQEMRLSEWERELRAKATIEIVDVGSGKTQGSENTAR